MSDELEEELELAETFQAKFKSNDNAMYPRHILEKMLLHNHISAYQFERMVQLRHISKLDHTLENCPAMQEIVAQDCIEVVKDVFEVEQDHGYEIPTKIGEE